MSTTLDTKLLDQVDPTPNYNSFKPFDKLVIENLYKKKLSQGELDPEDEVYEKGIEKCAILYRAQKCAFQDVLNKQGFDVVSEVPKDYEGRIAFLTAYGTLVMLGKYKRDGRYVTATRIHSPMLDHTGSREHLLKDVKLKKHPRLTTKKYSICKALAINPHGSDDDEIEAKQSQLISTCIGLETADRFIRETGHPVKSNVDVEVPEEVK